MKRDHLLVLGGFLAGAFLASVFLSMGFARMTAARAAHFHAKAAEFSTHASLEIQARDKAVAHANDLLRAQTISVQEIYQAAKEGEVERALKMRRASLRGAPH